MTRLHYWLLTSTSIVVGLLFLLQIYVSWQDRNAIHEFHSMEGMIQQGREYDTLWRQLAARTYQLSQQDPALHDLLVRRKIVVSPSASPTPAPAVSPISTPAGVPSAVKNPAH